MSLIRGRNSQEHHPNSSKRYRIILTKRVAGMTRNSAAKERCCGIRLARRFVRLFLDHIWEPFVRAGMPASDVPRVTAALQRLRPIASVAVDAVLAQAMDRATAEAALHAVRS